VISADLAVTLFPEFRQETRERFPYEMELSIEKDADGSCYYLVLLREDSMNAMTGWPQSFITRHEGGHIYIPIEVRLERRLVTHIRPAGKPHWRGTPFADTSLNKAADNEPIWVLRAQDMLAADVVLEWIERARAAGVDSKKIKDAEKHLARIREWPTKKLPD
jgi:hypothetical protein